MDESQSEEAMEIFSQDGVLLTTAPATYMSYINTSGTLCIVEYLNSNRLRCIEWKPNDVTIESDVQDQEWAVVNTIERRTRTLSGGLSSDPTNRSRFVKINLNEIKSFRVYSNSQRLSFQDGKGENICKFLFQHANCDHFVGTLRGLLRLATARRDKHMYVVLEDAHTSETQQLDKSFAELNLFQEPSSEYVWKFVRNFHNRPYETTMEAFSKITDIGKLQNIMFFNV